MGSWVHLASRYRVACAGVAKLASFILGSFCQQRVLCGARATGPVGAWHCGRRGTVGARGCTLYSLQVVSTDVYWVLVLGGT